MALAYLCRDDYAAGGYVYMLHIEVFMYKKLMNPDSIIREAIKMLYRKDGVKHGSFPYWPNQ